MTDIEANATAGTESVEEVSPEIKEMMEAGVFFGRKKSHTHPRMKQFVLSNRNGVEVINLHKTEEQMEEAAQLIKSKVGAGGSVLLVATQPAFADIVASFVNDTKTWVVAKRWLGGILTNFKVIFKRIEYMRKLKSDLSSGGLAKYTKKERLDFEKQLARLTDFLGGVEEMTKLPEVVVIIDPKIHMTALREANQLKIPVVAFTNVDLDPDIIPYVVIGNNKGRSSVGWFLSKVKAAVEEGKKAAVARAAEEVKVEKPA